MGWDAYLVDDRGHTEGDWNYTWNVGPMLRAAAEAVATNPIPDDTFMGIVGGLEVGFAHWLDGKTGAEGQALLRPLVSELEANPERYRAMNPPNGWGNYDGILRILKEMIAATPEWPTVWRVT